MPPKPKFTKEELVNAALALVGEKGPSGLTARDLGARLGTSASPIFTYFKSMAEVKTEVLNAAREKFKEYVKRGLESPVPFLGVGRQFVQFAKDEPELYRLLYLTRHEDGTNSAIQVLNSTMELVRDSIMKIYRMDAATADSYYRNMWLYGHSVASLFISGSVPFSDKEIEDMFAEMSLSLCKAYKEVPGLVEGTYDKDAVFSKIIAEDGD